MSLELPPYVVRSGEIVYAPPYEASRTRVLTFALPADQRRMSAMLARTFNAPSKGAVDFRAALPAILLVVAEIGALRPADPPDNTIGSAAEREVAVWMPVIDAARDELVWFHPYLFVDSGIATAAGREVHGFHKQVAGVTVGDRTAAGPLVGVDVTGITRFAPTARFETLRLLDVVQKGTPPALKIPNVAAGVGGLLRALGGGLAGLIETAGVIAHATRELAARTCTMVFLKQFRDVAQPDRACYQAIVRARTRVTAFHGAGLLGECAVTLNDLDTHPLRADLGLPAGVITPIASWWLAYDFVLEKGTERWHAKSS